MKNKNEVSIGEALFTGFNLGSLVYLNIRNSWSISESPWKRGRFMASSANIHPIDQTSTGVEYLGQPRRTSGARYHKVTTWIEWWCIINIHLEDRSNIWISSINPLTIIAISKLLEMIGRATYILACSIATTLYSGINQISSSSGHLSMWENRCMHTTVRLLSANQPKRASDAAKSGKFIGNSHGTNMSNGRQRVIGWALESNQITHSHSPRQV